MLTSALFWPSRANFGPQQKKCSKKLIPLDILLHHVNIFFVCGLFQKKCFLGGSPLTLFRGGRGKFTPPYIIFVFKSQRDTHYSPNCFTFSFYLFWNFLPNFRFIRIIFAEIWALPQKVSDKNRGFSAIYNIYKMQTSKKSFQQKCWYQQKKLWIRIICIVLMISIIYNYY